MLAGLAHGDSCFKTDVKDKRGRSCQHTVKSIPGINFFQMLLFLCSIRLHSDDVALSDWLLLVREISKSTNQRHCHQNGFFWVDPSLLPGKQQIES